MSEKPRSKGGRSALSLGFLSVLTPSEVGFVGGYLILNGVGRPLEFHCTTPVKPTRAQEILYGNSLQPYLCAEQIGPALITKAKTPVALICVDRWELLDLADHAGTPVAAVMLDAGAAPLGPPHFARTDRGGSTAAMGSAERNAVPARETPCFHDGTSTAWGNGPTDLESRRDGSPTAALVSAPPAPADTVAKRIPSGDGAAQGLYTPNGLECWQGRLGRTRFFCAAHHAPAVSRLLADWAPWTDALDLSEPFERIRAAIEEALRRG
ncbi:hypothetical protein [Thermopirellula anaerolimosa]